MNGPSASEAFEDIEPGAEIAKQVAALVWDATGYRFVYKKKISAGSSTVATYSYFCAQNEKEITKTRLIDDERKRRARMKMDRFPCNGWLHVTVDSADQSTVRLRMLHHRAHCKYVNISIGDEIKELVKKMKDQPASKIWTQVLQDYPATKMTQKQIYRLWSELNESAWRLDDDQVKSAQKLLEKMHGKEIELIPITQEDGIHCIAFGFKEILDAWAEKNEELAMDSTWKRNAAGYELYGVPPAAYDPCRAHQVFGFIDPTWAPGIPSGWVEDDDGDEALSTEREQDPSDSTPPSTCVLPVFILKTGDVRVPVYPNPPKLKGMTRDDPEERYISAGEIHKRATQELYQYYFRNDLAQPWAYMWNRWYCPQQWPLWARAACDAIPRLQTTMIVENLVTYLVIIGLLPRVMQNLGYVLGLRRVGRPQALAGWQIDFKATWVDMSCTDEHRLTEKHLKWLRTARNAKGREEHLQFLEEEARRPGVYVTDVDNWTCSCKVYPKNRFLICKHLVRKANKTLESRPLTDLRFFLDMRRNHYPPYYSIPGVNKADSDDEEEPVETTVLVLGQRGSSPFQRTVTPSQSPSGILEGSQAPADAPAMEQENPPVMSEPAAIAIDPSPGLQNEAGTPSRSSEGE
ncbi:hypothetical protein FB451DRAFT_1561138 [Mycena latifolia]|nr:hypothetical protein FB451DRAFT_1561138 [Mycena latifolia]